MNLQTIGIIVLILWIVIAVPTYEHWSAKRHYERMKDKSLTDGYGYGINGKKVYHLTEIEHQESKELNENV